MTSTNTGHGIPPLARIQRLAYLTRLSWAMPDLPAREWRAIRADLVSATDDAAREAGMRRALADLGAPGVLAARYLEASDAARRPRWTLAGTVTALVAGAHAYLVVAFGAGMAEALNQIGGHRQASSYVLGVRVAAWSEAGSFGAAFDAHTWWWAIVLALAAIFVLTARIWRLRTRPRRPMAARQLRRRRGWLTVRLTSPTSSTQE
ncbi:MAG: hypothetical protein LBO20_06370 [Bifidobacteriaceae bacterium]|jgi:hypothetical protein|nr:hypothetical protein [Bifidobacteriaceae bacterium]